MGRLKALVTVRRGHDIIYIQGAELAVQFLRGEFGNCAPKQPPQQHPLPRPALQEPDMEVDIEMKKEKVKKKKVTADAGGLFSVSVAGGAAAKADWVALDSLTATSSTTSTTNACAAVPAGAAGEVFLFCVRDQIGAEGALEAAVGSVGGGGPGFVKRAGGVSGCSSARAAAASCLLHGPVLAGNGSWKGRRGMRGVESRCA